MLNIPTTTLTPEANEERERIAASVARELRGPVVVSKGAFDVVTNGDVSVRCTEPSTPRRCGGQGDVLSGSAALFVSWAKRAASVALPPLFLAGYAACVMTRRAAHTTFRERGRSMVAGDMLLHLTEALESIS